MNLGSPRTLTPDFDEGHHRPPPGTPRAVHLAHPQLPAALAGASWQTAVRGRGPLPSSDCCSQINKWEAHTQIKGRPFNRITACSVTSTRANYLNLIPGSAFQSRGLSQGRVCPPGDMQGRLVTILGCHMSRGCWWGEARDVLQCTNGPAAKDGSAQNASRAEGQKPSMFILISKDQNHIKQNETLEMG